MFDVRKMATGLGFAEGPVALLDGSILVGDLATGRLLKAAPDGEVTVVAEVGGGPNGLAVGPDGRVFIANNGGGQFDRRGQPLGSPSPDYDGGAIQAIDLVTGDLEEIADRVGDHRLAGPNDLVFDAEGGLYFTDFGKRQGRSRILGGLYYLPSGSREPAELVWPLETPNGIALSADGRELFVAETATARVWSWQIEAPGVLRSDPATSGRYGRLVCTVPGDCRLDSMAVDGCGHVCVATLNRGVITVIGAGGVIEATVPLPELDPYVTNLCFRQTDDGTTAYVTASSLGKLFAIEWPWPTLPLNFHDRLRTN